MKWFRRKKKPVVIKIGTGTIRVRLLKDSHLLQQESASGEYTSGGAPVELNRVYRFEIPAIPPGEFRS